MILAVRGNMSAEIVNIKIRQQAKNNNAPLDREGDKEAIKEVLDMIFPDKILEAIADPKNPAYLSIHIGAALTKLANDCKWEAMKAYQASNDTQHAIWIDRGLVVNQCLDLVNKIIKGE